MHITKLVTENFMKIKLVQVEPDGSLVIIGGNNEQGKTSLLDSIEALLNGAKAIPHKPVRDGEETSTIEAELSNGFTVERKISDSGKSQLIIRNSDGSRFSSPQTVLDKLTGALSFDPLAFKIMDDKKRVDLLKETFGIDFTDLDKEKADIYQERTLMNREVKDLDSQIKAGAIFKDAPDEMISTEDLTKELEEAHSVNAQNSKNKQGLEILNKEVEHMETEIVRLENDAATLKAKRDETKARIVNGTAIVNKENDIDVTEILQKINSAEKDNAKIRSNADLAVLKNRRKKKAIASDGISDRLVEIEDEKKSRMNSADFPVKGLGFDDTGVTFNGIPFDQASGAEKLKISLSIAMSANPELKVILIRDGSLLDEQNLALINDMANKAETQVWIEMVGEREDMGLILEDGQIKGEAKEAS